MTLTDLRIGYSSYSHDFTAPGDRRRFIFYAKEKNLHYELADSKKHYDLIYVTTSANISEWIDYKKRHPGTKLIFEIIDSYLLEGRSIRTYFKGLFRFLTSKDNRLYFNYQNAFIEIIKIADAVVCSTLQQQKVIQRYNKNVHVSLDFFSEDISYHKKNYVVDEKIKLVWEGQAYTVKNLLKLNDVFKVLSNRIELHVITDPIIRNPLGIFHTRTSDFLKKLPCRFYLHNWELKSFSQIIANADLAIIPMDMSDKLILNKPENKLLLLWEIGIPVLTSATPAYKKVMESAELENYCFTKEEWLKKLEKFLDSDIQQRIQDVNRANLYLTNHHQKEQLIANWEKILLSVLK